MKKGTKQRLQRALHEAGLSEVDLGQVVGGIASAPCGGSCSESCERGCSGGCVQSCQVGKAKGVIAEDISPIGNAATMAA